MFDVVSKVEHYSEFVPWCKESLVPKRNKDAFLCKLTVGFPPVVERYTSRVTVSRPSFVKVRFNSGSWACHCVPTFA